jgi:hypothetical protein
VFLIFRQRWHLTFFYLITKVTRSFFILHNDEINFHKKTNTIILFCIDMAGHHGLLPSDLGSDAWSDLTSEFSDTKFRKHPNIRTSTPNMTRQSSSLSSKEVGQIRKQLTGSY